MADTDTNSPTPLKVLVVEDDQNIGQLLQFMLRTTERFGLRDDEAWLGGCAPLGGGWRCFEALVV